MKKGYVKRFWSKIQCPRGYNCQYHTFQVSLICIRHPCELFQSKNLVRLVLGSRLDSEPCIALQQLAFLWTTLYLRNFQHSCICLTLSSYHCLCYAKYMKYKILLKFAEITFCLLNCTNNMFLHSIILHRREKILLK